MNGSYRVIWEKRVVEVKIADFVVAAMQTGTGAARTTAAMNEIDRRLETNPHAEGESRNLGQRILIVPPLAVIYEIDDEAQVALIVNATYRPMP